MSNADGTPLAGAPVRGRSFRGRFIGLNVSGGGEVGRPEEGGARLTF